MSKTSYFVGVRHNRDGFEGGTFLASFEAARRCFRDELEQRGITPPQRVAKLRTEVPLDDEHSFVLVQGH